jgi:hypothetical protein
MVRWLLTYAQLGIFNTTIAHPSFNIYMFNNTTGDAILIGVPHSWPFPLRDCIAN